MPTRVYREALAARVGLLVPGRVPPAKEIPMRLFDVKPSTCAATAVVLCAFSLSASAQDIGVAACDKFITTYVSCVGAKAPEAQRSVMTSVIEQLKTNWKSVAATPEGKTSLEKVCKDTSDMLKTQVASLNCPW